MLTLQLFVAATPEVTTTTGVVSGLEQDGVHGFLGIPFAAPPTGARRLLPPMPHPDWTGVLPATEAGSQCLQGDGPKPKSPCGTWCKDHGHAPDACGCGVCGSFGHCSFSCSADNQTRVECPHMQGAAAGRQAMSEDCLFINAFTPAAPSNASRPVMVHIHGGGFVAGGATTAWNLTRNTGSVVFSIQYRLGAMGFFSPTDNATTAPTNLGIQDQVFALRWVAANARSFGGDTSRVMIFGCSAGGASVAGFLVDPATWDLFHAAGIESPGGHQGWMTDVIRTDDDWMASDLSACRTT